MDKTRAPRNRTLTIDERDALRYRPRLKQISRPISLPEIIDSTIHQDLFSLIEWLPKHSVDLLFADPPYNLTKSFNGKTFNETDPDTYERWLDSWLGPLTEILKPTASVYVCGDWRSSAAIQRVLERHFFLRNRIVWEREKGRGAKSNWKNCCEDIWYSTVSNDYTFDLESVMIKRRVLAPYRHSGGMPKDWEESEEGRFRITHPSNIWTDITVPFWSMPENTDHPTQKPEKLLAKIILASSREGDVVFDPFSGSGTASVAAKKLGRRYIGVEIDETYCLLIEKRLEMAGKDRSIQGYSEGVFWERNTLAYQNKMQAEEEHPEAQILLF
ncbi:MAG: site-specific DNA-methyltransferase [Pirellulales bacterium]|nr:site-specific DNA-methyltransferase [Pirellulales bacterium]